MNSVVVAVKTICLCVFVMFEAVFPPLCLSAVMQEGNTVLTINGSTDLGNGVEVFVDPTGVTAKVTMGSNAVSVFFDGNTAQIIFIGTETEILPLTTEDKTSNCDAQPSSGASGLNSAVL